MTSTQTTDIREFGHELWEYLTGKEAVISYTFEDMTVEVPKTTAPDSPRAAWQHNGTLRIKTTDKDNAGAPRHRGRPHRRGGRWGGGPGHGHADR